MSMSNRVPSKTPPPDNNNNTDTKHDPLPPIAVAATPAASTVPVSSPSHALKRRSITSIYDPFRPLSVEACARGWIGKKQEFSYWIPAADIQGTIPPELVGTVFRNGPGIDEIYGTKLKHPIDGDGMICAVSFTGTGYVHFQSRFVAHKARVEETYAHRMLYRGQMGTLPHHWAWDTLSGIKGIMTGNIPRHEYRNPSNTNVFYWGGKLLSCYETGLPHVLDPRTLETLGTDDLGGVLTIGNMAAHFRYDPVHDRLVTISLRPGLTGPGQLGIYEFDRTWKLVCSQIHRIPGLNYSHDFLLTHDYYIFHMTPFVKIDMKSVRNIILGLSSPGSEMKYYSDLPSRIILIPRDRVVPLHQLIQIPVDPFHVFHFGNVNETRDSSNRITHINFNAVCLDKTFDMTFDQQVWLSNASISPGKLHHITLDVINKTSKRTRVDDASSEVTTWRHITYHPMSCDCSFMSCHVMSCHYHVLVLCGQFPSVHPYRHGEPCRYVWMMASARPHHNLPYRDIVKYDSQGQRAVYHSHGCVGEPIFIPRHGYHSAKLDVAKEDDGWVFVQVFHPETQRTDFVILDAISMYPLCTIKLHQHIPYGFHGTHTPNIFVQETMPAQPVIAFPVATSLPARL